MDNKVINKEYEVDGWLPLFHGFYNTIWDDDGEQMEQGLKEDGATEEEIDYVYGSDVYIKACEAQRKEVSHEVTQAIEKQLQSDNLLTAIKFDKLVSPRFYNYSNDSINVTYTVTDANLKELETYIADNLSSFTQYIKDNYTSYDGFYSSYSNGVTDWINDLKDRIVLTNSHMLSAIYNFYFENEKLDQLWLYYECEGSAYTYVSLEDLRAEIKADKK